MPLPTGPAPWFGLSEETLRSLEIHSARAVAIPGRGWRDLGDAVLLFSAGEKEPFFNRLTAVRWPEDPRAFDARLRQANELFAALDRKPYAWVIPGLSTPADLTARLTLVAQWVEEVKVLAPKAIELYRTRLSGGGCRSQAARCWSTGTAPHLRTDRAWHRSWLWS